MIYVSVYGVTGDLHEQVETMESAETFVKMNTNEKTWGVEIFGRDGDTTREVRKYRLPKGFYKVKQDGGTFVTALFYNPETKESFDAAVRDYDYSDCSRDIDVLYNVRINEDVRRIYLHDKGVIQEGDTVRVIKGRKIPIGTVAKVRAIHDFCDCYGRFRCRYLYFEEGGKTNIENCELVEAV